MNGHVKYHSPGPEGELPDAYRRLMAAVFGCACQDYQATANRYLSGAKCKASHNLKIRDEARDWFLSPEQDWPFSLHTICAVTGWREQSIRNAIRDREALRESD